MPTGDPLEIRLLGGFSVARGERSIRLPTRKAQALLARLALRPGTALARERLANLLWSRSAPAQARSSLRQALAQLRRALRDAGPDPIATAGEAVALRADAAVVDTAVLETALSRGTPEGADTVASLYRGDLLDGFVLRDEPFFEDWLQAEVEHLRRRTLRVLIGRLQALVDAQAIEAAIALGERLLALDPAGEEIHQALIRLDIGRGALGSAMRRYECCRSVLGERLGVPPSAETQRLGHAIRARPTTVSAQDGGAPPTVAVLPFADRTTGNITDYLALGFAEEVTRVLARFRSLRVIAAQSAFLLAESGGDPRQNGADLGARYVLAGSIAAAGDTLRIGVDLLDSASGHCVWSERYDARAAEVLAAQDDIARSVAAALAVRIDGDLLRAAARKPLESLEAYDCWLRGMALLRQGTPESLLDARPLFHRALAIDPGFARAYTGLSLSHFNEWSCVFWERWQDNEREAYRYAEQGVRMDDSDHMTHFVLGRILLYRREFERAERDLERAEALNPNDADMLIQLACSDALLGHAERGIERLRLARRLNPYHNDWYFAFAACTALLARRLPEAVDFARRAPHVATDMHACMACALAHQGRLDEARRHRDAFLALFRQRICTARAPAADDPVRWLLHVNPMRRSEDRTFVLAGLARAGLAVPADAEESGRWALS